MKTKYYLTGLVSLALFTLSASADESEAINHQTAEVEVSSSLSEVSELFSEASLDRLLEEKLTIRFDISETDISGKFVWNSIPEKFE